MTGRTITARGARGYATADDPTGILVGASRWALFVARFRRQHGPLIRYWDAEMRYVGTDPDSGRIESWPSWWRRQYRRVFRRYTGRRYSKVR